MTNVLKPHTDISQQMTGSKVHPEQSVIPQRRLYMQVVVIESLMQSVSPGSRWAERLAQLLAMYPSVSRAHMGFPERWDEGLFWSDAIRNSR